MHKQLQVPEVEGIDLDFTPAAYFTARDLQLALPSDIRGQARRDLARKLAAQGAALPQELTAPELTVDDRRAWGAIHPMLMGGEYLPPMGQDVVEVARISLESVTADQISVRARRTPEGIAYTIVDEYDGADNYTLDPSVSHSPLSMRQLIAMLDGACERGGAVMSPVVWHIEDGMCGTDEMRGFVSVESDFYPDLGAYYNARFEQWFAENAAASAEDDE